MNVVNARPNLIGILKGLKGIKQIHIGARGFDGDHIRIHGGNILDDVVKLAVAHMGVNLGFVLNPTGGDAKAFHRPLQVGWPVRLTQRQPFANGRFVDLDDADAGLFQVQHLIAQCQCQLQARRFPADILTGK